MTDMFLCECHSCGRRELRGPRSLVLSATGLTATCRACGTEVLIAATRPAEAPPAQILTAA